MHDKRSEKKMINVEVTRKKLMIDNYTIAEIELKQKVLPFVVKRPLGHGGCEYWRINDLEILL